MFKSRTCKTCVHYLSKPEWKAEEKPNDFTGYCTLYPPEFVKRDPAEISNREKALNHTSISSLFRLTRETAYCGQHITRLGKVIERFYPVIYVVVGSVCTTIGAYIIHILTKP